MLEPFWFPRCLATTRQEAPSSAEKKQLRYCCYVFFVLFFCCREKDVSRGGESVAGERSLEIFSLARHHFGFLLTVELFSKLFWFFWSRRKKVNRTSTKMSIQSTDFSAFVWQSIICRWAEMNKLTAALRMLAVNDLSMKLLRCDAHWRQTMQSSIVRHQVGSDGEWWMAAAGAHVSVRRESDYRHPSTGLPLLGGSAPNFNQRNIQRLSLTPDVERDCARQPYIIDSAHKPSHDAPPSYSTP